MYLVPSILSKLTNSTNNVLRNGETVLKTVQNYLFPNVFFFCIYKSKQDPHTLMEKVNVLSILTAGETLFFLLFFFCCSLCIWPRYYANSRKRNSDRNGPRNESFRFRGARVFRKEMFLASLASTSKTSRSPSKQDLQVNNFLAPWLGGVAGKGPRNEVTSVPPIFMQRNTWPGQSNSDHEYNSGVTNYVSEFSFRYNIF